jgi:hypothetical protein
MAGVGTGEAWGTKGNGRGGRFFEKKLRKKLLGKVFGFL